MKNLKFKTFKKISKKLILEVEISTERDYFSITGTTYEKLTRGQKYYEYKVFNGEKFEVSTGGCIHDTILKHFPKFNIFVNLHLSDVSGLPMHCFENGFYHLQGFLGIASYNHKSTKETVLEHFRINENEFYEMIAIMQSNQEKIAKIKIASFISDKLIERYENEAKNALNELSNLINN